MYVILIHQRYRRTDRRTDGQTDGRHAIAIPTLCTIVHRAVKTRDEQPQSISGPQWPHRLLALQQFVEVWRDRCRQSLVCDDSNLVPDALLYLEPVQCNDFNSGLALTRLRCWQMTRATLFWTLCSLSITATGTVNRCFVYMRLEYVRYVTCCECTDSKRKNVYM